VLRTPELDAFKELVLTLPSECYVADQLERRPAAHPMRRARLTQLASASRDWEWAFERTRCRRLSPGPVRGRRALANLALPCSAPMRRARRSRCGRGRAYQRFKDAANMTEHPGRADRSPACRLAVPCSLSASMTLQGDALVIDKWFSLQAMAPEKDGRVLARVQQLMTHPDFNIGNPNRARSLIAAFCMSNPGAFHRADAAGYRFWADRVLDLDSANPQLAARMARVMDRWSKLAEPYRSGAHEALSRVAARPHLSSDVREIVARALDA
jgi:aminopeptidase N